VFQTRAVPDIFTVHDETWNDWSS